MCPEDKWNVEAVRYFKMEQFVEEAVVLKVEHVVEYWNAVTANLCGDISGRTLEERVTEDAPQCNSLLPKTLGLRVQFVKIVPICFVSEKPAAHLVKVIV